ncbi:MAG TPA: hypothetical protein VK672_04160 [Solirubrobacteraceae bacterium]|jgi:hypothetical protein|nr:hypothetical protein [Solirubrobacteraceae bacterium]
MYHVELRQFPHNCCRFNLTEQQLRETILDAWARGDWIELGERKWSPHQAKLKVLDGPELPVQQLSMGRGWRNALRQSKDVTTELLARAGAGAHDHAVGSKTSEPSRVADPGPSATSSRELADATLARELLALLGDDPGPLLRAWQLALERHPDRPPSECLALAEDFVRP